MATYATFQDAVAILRESTWGTAATAGTHVIPAGGPIGIPITNFPFIDPGVATIESAKYTGRSYTGSDVSEIMRGILSPKMNLEFDVNGDTLVPFLATLFQRDGTNALQGAATLYNKTFRAYTSDPDLASKTGYMSMSTADSTVPMSLTVVHKNGAASEGHALLGAIAKSITISGSQNEVVKASVELLGKTMITNRDFSSDVFTFNTDATTLFQNMQFELGTTSTRLCAFSITIDNNATQRFCNSQTVNRIVYGKITVTGSITIPFDGNNTILDAFKGAVSSNIQRLEFSNTATGIDGTPSASGDWYIKCGAVITGYTETEMDGEKLMEISFTSVYDNSILTTGPIEIQIADSLSYLDA